MSYFDNQYGGEDDDNKFYGDKEPDEDEDEDEEEKDKEEEEVDEDLEEDDLQEEDDDVEVEEDEDDDQAGDLEEEEDEDQTGGAGSDDESDSVEKKATKIKKVPAKNVYKKPIDFIDNDDDDDEEGEQYLQKFSHSVNDNYILNFHPESISQNYDEIVSMTKVVRNAQGIIIDLLHRTIPFLTKYEKARILGQRAKQINSGATPFVKVPENVIDGYIIAEMELKQKRIPFIIRIPLPNGGSEYWRVQDLVDISF